MGHRELRVVLPLDLSNERYASIVHTVFSVLEAAGIADGSSILVDGSVTDAEMNKVFDAHNARYPWGDG